MNYLRFLVISKLTRVTYGKGLLISMKKETGFGAYLPDFTSKGMKTGIITLFLLLNPVELIVFGNFHVSLCTHA